MVKNFISAKDAKELTVTSDKLLTQVYKLIRDAASYGHCRVEFSVFGVDSAVVAKIKNSLTQAEYTVEEQSDEGTNDLFALIITW